MPDIYDDITGEFEAEHLRSIERVERAIKKLYYTAIEEIALSFTAIRTLNKTFYLKDHPALLYRIKQQVAKLHASIYATIINSIEENWNLANEKNSLFVDKRLAGKTPSAKAVQILYDPNLKALESFKKRATGGLNLSDRVWNSLDGFRTEMEAVLGVGVSEGKSAAQMANGMKRFLNEPDRLFRRIRNDKGELKLSKAAREYHPGQGVYRSSYKNALRLTASETNMAYRTSDYERWQTLPFVIGIKINLSNNHPVYDICDELTKGTYPKDFLFRGFHPFCRCYATPIMMSDKEYSKYEDAILAGTDKDFQIKGQITAPPKAFEKWVTKNEERINGWSNKPYWWSDNQKYVEQALNK